MHLQHLHLPGLTRYQLVSHLQDRLVRQKITHHHPAPNSSPTTSPRSIVSRLAPSPLLLTFTPPPTYTSGRRQTLTDTQIQVLEHSLPHSPTQDAVYVHSPRGGLLTFHGPGQVTAYPILHLRSHGLTVRTYISLLESAIIRALQHYGVSGFTRPEYPGVWVSPAQKLASVGVHVQRGVTCFGTGVNVSTDRKWWERFTACGIEGVEMLGLLDLGVRGVDGEEGVRAVGDVLARELAGLLEGVSGVDRVDDGDGKALLKMAEEREKLGEG